MNRRPERLAELLPGVLAQLAPTSTATNGDLPMTEDDPTPQAAAGDCTCGAPNDAHCKVCWRCPGDSHDEACGWVCG